MKRVAIVMVAAAALVLGLEGTARAELSGATLVKWATVYQTIEHHEPQRNEDLFLNTAIYGGFSGFVNGVLDTMAVLSKEIVNPPWTKQRCLPPGVTREDVVRTVAREVLAHPEHHDESAVAQVIGAVRRAFPCPKDTK